MINIIHISDSDFDVVANRCLITRMTKYLLIYPTQQSHIYYAHLKTNQILLT